MNPYKFFRGASFFLQPSYQEAESIVIKEALALHLPVLCTETVSAGSMVNEKYGEVCENSDKALGEALEDFMINKKYEEKAANLKEYVASDEQAVKQFVNLIG